MEEFVLIHGAWHGGWCWKNVKKILENKGCNVYTPTLTGVGERSHLFNTNINLDIHIEDIINLILWEDLENIVLCGHSYGGMVITGVADKIPERIKSLVYLDAFAPENGFSAFDYYDYKPLDALLELRENAKNTGIMLPPPSSWFGLSSSLQHWTDSKLTKHPANTFIQKISLQGNHNKIKNKFYINAKKCEINFFDIFYQQLRYNPEWRCEIIEYGHDVMIQNPSLTAELLFQAI